MQSTHPTNNYESDNASEYHASYFATKDYLIVADELAETITTSAADQSSLNQQIQETFEVLSNQGIENPILIGAIPFDTEQASSLNFYGSYQKQSKTPASENGSKSQIDLKIRDKKRLTDETHFKTAVHQALLAFSQQDLKKIVLSQAMEIELSQQQQPLELAQHLFNKNPDAYTFAIPVTDNKIILGASPELLISKQDRYVISSPLAGSKPKASDSERNAQSKHELKQSTKDNHEHRFVVENIMQNLAPYCVQISASEYPSVLETSTMLHLSSILEGQLRYDAPDALNLALSLHPTPAVCGTPTALAKQFILENEGYDRNYYAGLVGWMDANGNGEWVVTIRCGLLDEQRMQLYAGAGIVVGSNAESEWLETEAKLQTMLNIFNINPN